MKETETIIITRNSPGVTLYGVKETGNSRLVAPILFPRTLGERHLIIWNPDGILGKEFYKVLPYDKKFSIFVAAQLNSTFGVLQREIIGSVALGSGGLKFSASDVGLFMLLPVSEIARSQTILVNAFTALSYRPIRSIFEELGFPLCRERKCGHPEHPYERVRPGDLTLEQVQRVSPDRFELDRVVFDALGLTDEERQEVYRAVAQLVKDRLVKARSV